MVFNKVHPQLTNPVFQVGVIEVVLDIRYECNIFGHTYHIINHIMSRSVDVSTIETPEPFI